VICGHLDPNLVLLADELLTAEDTEEVSDSGVLAAAELDPSDAGHARHGEFDEDPLERLAQRALPI
jgi:hypothetical protein